MQASASVTASGDSKAAIGEALKQAVSGNRLQSISLHDERGDVLWLDEGALGPDEHNLVMEAAAALTAGADKTYVFQNIGDGRAAAFLPARSPLNDLVGIAMIIADAKFLDSKGAAKFVTPTTTNLMRRLAFLRRPPAPGPAAAPAPPAAPPAAAKVVSPPPPARPAAPRPAVPPAAARPGVSTAPAAGPAAPPAPAMQRPAAPPARPSVPAAPAAARPPMPARPAAPPPKAAQPAKPAAAPPPRPAAPAKPVAQQQRPSGSAESDSIAFEISDIDPKSLLKQPARQVSPEAKRPDLRVVQTDRLPKLELALDADPIPELIADEAPPAELPQIDTTDDVGSEEPTTEVEALADPETDMNVEPEYVDEAAQLAPGPGQFEFYGQVFELHVQQLIKLKGSGGTRRFEVLVRDANADNEFGVAPERVVQDAHDPSANSDLDRIVVEQLVSWLGENRGVWESEPASFSVNVGMGTIADSKFASFVATALKNHKVHPKALGFEISEKSCIEQVRDVDQFVLACEKIGCHVVLDDFTMHHNAMRWLGSSALKFLKLDPRITAVAMKERVPQALVVAIAQASKVLGLSCVAKRVDTPAVRDWMAAVGVDYAQGFLLDQPKALISLIAASGK
jgi:EAL domain-containing protein (putative c-di-GMP-specific phosphodiesterase class I)